MHISDHSLSFDLLCTHVLFISAPMNRIKLHWTELNCWTELTSKFKEIHRVNIKEHQLWWIELEAKQRNLQTNFKNYAEYVQEIEHQLLIFSPFCAHQSMDGPVSEKSIEFTVLYKSQVENLSKHECK